MTRVRAFDWLRGIAVLVMIQTHALVLLEPPLPAGPFWARLQWVDGLVAPAFLFGAGFPLQRRLLARPRPGPRGRGRDARSARAQDAAAPRRGAFCRDPRELDVVPHLPRAALDPAHRHPPVHRLLVAPRITDPGVSLRAPAPPRLGGSRSRRGGVRHLALRRACPRPLRGACERKQRFRVSAPPLGRLRLPRRLGRRGRRGRWAQASEVDRRPPGSRRRPVGCHSATPRRLSAAPVLGDESRQPRGALDAGMRAAPRSPRAPTGSGGRLGDLETPVGRAVRDLVTRRVLLPPGAALLPDPRVLLRGGLGEFLRLAEVLGARCAARARHGRPDLRDGPPLCDLSTNHRSRPARAPRAERGRTLARAVKRTSSRTGGP